MSASLKEAVEKEFRAGGVRTKGASFANAVEVAVRMVEKERTNGPEPPYPYFWRTQIQRAKEKAHRIMGELRRQAAKSSGWKQRFKSTRGTVPVMAREIKVLRARAEAAEKALVEQREKLGDIVRDCYSQLSPDEHPTAVVALQMAECKVRRGTYSDAPQPGGGEHGE